MEPPQPAVRALWDPSTGTVPSPTDLVRDRATGRLAVAIDPESSQAQQEFNAYLNTLDGYPLVSSLKIPMSGPVQPASLAGAFFLMDAADGTRPRLALDFDAEHTLITATPGKQQDAQFLPGRTYIFGLRGYDGGLRGAAGEPVIADAGFYLVRSHSPLTRHPEVMPGDTEEERLATATQLGQVQAAYAPLIDQVRRAWGFPREELAVLASFSTTSMPAVWFDAASGRIPLPNQLLIDPSSARITLPEDPQDDEETREVKETLSAYDGFSISGAIVLKSTHPVDRESVLDPAAIRLFKRGAGDAFEEVTELERGVLSDETTFWIRPELTLEAGTDYVYVTTRKLRDSRGQPLGAQPLGALLRGSAPLVDAAGAPNVSVIDAATAARLEPVRQRAQPLLDSLRQDLVIRPDVGAAVPFHTVSAAQTLLERRAELYRQNVRTDLVNVEVKTPLARGLWVAMPRVRTIVSGQMFIHNRLDPHTRRNYEDGHAEDVPASFVLTIPTGVQKGEKIPVVLFGHGLMTSRELTYLIADKLAGAGYAVFSLDLPYHGDRAICTEDVNCRGQARCDDLGQCINPDGSKGEIATFRVPFIDAEYPSSTGFAFIDVDNLIGTRDHFAQALLDLMQGVRVIQQADWAHYADGYTLDPDDIVYLGMSLGGILGANLAALEPALKSLALNVPGADYLSIIENSASFQSLFNDALAARAAPHGSDAYFDFSNVIRWLLDPVDPLNIAHHATLDPLGYIDPISGDARTMPTKRVLLQMAKGDAVVPNIATQILSQRLQVPVSVYEPTVTNHGFLFDPTSLSGMAARNELVEFFNARE